MKYPKLVIEEAKALKKYATKKEKDKLNFERLNPSSKFRCVYGQMTGHCDSDRSVELIKKCCKRVYKALDGIYTKERDGKVNPVNGSPNKLTREHYWSPIEVFIVRTDSSGNREANNKLIKFIKGEIKTL